MENHNPKLWRILSVYEHFEYLDKWEREYVLDGLRAIHRVKSDKESIQFKKIQTYHLYKV